MTHLADTFAPRTVRHLAKVISLSLTAMITMILSGCGDRPTPVLQAPKEINRYNEPVENDKLSFFFWESRIVYKDEAVELRVSLHVKNKTSETLDLRKLGMQLLDSQGTPVPEYFQAFPPTATVEPNSAISFMYRCRPTVEMFSGPLVFSLGDLKKVVKDRNPVEEHDLPNTLGLEKSYVGPNWTDSKNVRLVSDKELDATYEEALRAEKEKRAKKQP